MEHADFRKWLEAIDGLSDGQRAEVQAMLAGRSGEAEVIAALEHRVMAERRCPHCETVGAIVRGRANGLRRLHCRGCNKTFNALTGTPLSHLHLKDRWMDFARSLSEREVVRKSAERCGVAISTAFRWRHRFLRAIQTNVTPLSGIVEADETYVLESRKGSRDWQRTQTSQPGAKSPDRKARTRGGTATKRGLSFEQVPVLVAADRSGATLSAILPAVSAEALANALRPVLSKDALLVTDGATPYPSCARQLGVAHEVLRASIGEHVRGDLHIQTVNSRHERLKDLLRRHRGVASKYLDSYLKWFHLATIRLNPTPRACLNAAIQTYA